MSRRGIPLREFEFQRCTSIQTFPYPTASKSFLYTNGFMAKSGAQIDVQKRNEQTDKQTKKLNVFAAPAAGEIGVPPNFTR